MIVTNAAGGLNESYNVGGESCVYSYLLVYIIYISDCKTNATEYTPDIVSVMDYFALPMLAGKNPLVGHNDDELGPRFPPTSNAFDTSLQDIVMESAKTLKMDDFMRKDGTYCFVSGPMYESRAECRFLRGLGGDCVGMSTVPEIVAAHHAQMKVICLSLITNKVVMKGDEGPPASHEEVLEAVNIRSLQIQGLVKEIVKSLNSSGILDGIPDLPPINLSIQSKKKMCLCPYTLVTSTPLHCLVMGFGVIALGAMMCKKR